MKIVKPDHLGLLYRCTGAVEQPQLVLGMLGLFRFGDVGEAALLPESALWRQVARTFGDNAILDEGWPKPVGEWMVYGDAFAPEGKPVPVLDVTACVGAVQKSVRIIGDRVWLDRNRCSAPPYA